MLAAFSGLALVILLARRLERQLIPAFLLRATILIIGALYGVFTIDTLVRLGIAKSRLALSGTAAAVGVVSLFFALSPFAVFIHLTVAGVAALCALAAPADVRAALVGHITLISGLSEPPAAALGAEISLWTRLLVRAGGALVTGAAMGGAAMYSSITRITGRHVWPAVTLLAVILARAGVN